jgi:hypothetical protein
MHPSLRNAFGMVLIAAGIIVVPIPILPGLPLIAAGAALLGSHHPLIRTAVTWLRKHRYIKEESRGK